MYWSSQDEDMWLEAMWESVVAHHHKNCATMFDSFKSMCGHVDKFWDLTMFGDIIKTKFGPLVGKYFAQFSFWIFFLSQRDWDQWVNT